ncbi:TPA: AMP-binding protein [Salmonella enterica subsp. diarizonae]|nr:AMP-binding protein [Salmonella enterica subsp. diarizonae]
MDYCCAEMYAKMQPRITAITGCHAFDYIAFRDSVRISTDVYSTTGDNGSLTQRDPVAEHLPMLLGATSGTTGAMKMVSVRLKSSKDAVSSSEHNLIHTLRARQVFSPGDVVGNLFTINLFSSLHYSACEILKHCRAHVVPVGDIALLLKSHYDFLAEIRLSALFGVPATIVQFVETMISFGVPLAIKKVVFTGEPMLVAHENYLREVLGDDLRIIGLYGLSECGFIGISVEGQHNQYLLFSDDFFFEYEDEKGLLVTSLDPDSSRKLVRYPVGDMGKLSFENNDIYFQGIKRNAVDFNFMGNLISHEKIFKMINRRLPDAIVQIVLSLSEDRQEIMDINICCDVSHDLYLSELEDEICHFPDIYEAYMKNRGRINLTVVEYNALLFSPRGKCLLVCDVREIC